MGHQGGRGSNIRGETKQHRKQRVLGILKHHALEADIAAKFMDRSNTS